MNKEPVFPIKSMGNFHDGISLRDYFAGQMLMALGASEVMSNEQIADWCYDIADALLKRKEEKE